LGKVENVRAIEKVIYIYNGDCFTPSLRSGFAMTLTAYVFARNEVKFIPGEAGENNLE
jgi:hypothetical protein